MESEDDYQVITVRPRPLTQTEVRTSENCPVCESTLRRRELPGRHCDWEHAMCTTCGSAGQVQLVLTVH